MTYFRQVAVQMKEVLRKIFWPILRQFETGKPVRQYKHSHRIILVVVGALFFVLSTASGIATVHSGNTGALIPVFVFFAVGVVTLVVGSLGSNDAVSRIWGQDK